MSAEPPLPDPAEDVRPPNDLPARLQAAGVTDDASLQAVLARDPQLRADFDAYLQANPEALVAANMNTLLHAFAAVENGEQLFEFWRSVPSELEEPFTSAVEALIEQAQTAGDRAAVEHLTPRLAGFQQIQADAQLRAAIEDLLDTFVALDNNDQVLDFWRGVPSELEEPFISAVESLLAQAQADGDSATVAQITPRLAGFKTLHIAAQEQQNQPPVVRALRAFVQAADEVTARTLFDQQRALLQPYEAQRMLEQFSSDDPATQQRLAERGTLLRELRGAAPKPVALPTATSGATFDNQGLAVTGDLYQAERQYLFSAHAEGSGTAMVVNNLFVQNLVRRWTPPQPHALDRDAVARPEEMAQIQQALATRGQAAITGQATVSAPALAVQGAPGVGKTTLAHLLALDAQTQARYPDGVIWEQLGPDFTKPEQAQAILRRWAGYATNFFELGDNLNQLFRFEAEAVRSLFAEHARLLVVLDNVWSLTAIQPLRAALPPGAHLLVTTRQRDLATRLGAGLVAVGLLRAAEARTLFQVRLQWQPDPQQAADHWALELVDRVGRHALGLDVALGVLAKYGSEPADWQPIAVELVAAIQQGDVDQFQLGADDPGHNVKAVLMFSYQALAPLDQDRYRALAAFAPEADFRTETAAALWDCAPRAALETLTAFANAALLERKGGGLWRQHALLRAFALALLRSAGEVDASAAAHARAYTTAITAADNEQRYYELLPALPQLRHAFAWAVANDLALALDLAASSATLQAQFGLARESSAWAEQLLAAAQARATPATLARAHGHRATILSDLATLPGEDRGGRLYAALAAYDEALRFYQPDTAPLAYAMTQNNRATILSDLATLPGEDRRTRLYAALAAYDEALRFRRPDTAPLDYAMTQNNRATILSDLATLPGEDRRTRLYAALAAYDEALRFYQPDTAPLAYASTQNNRATILSDLATLPGEDRRTRLYAALAAYDEALRFRRPDTAPLAYAMTQNNRANRLSELATLPGEDRRTRLYAALAAYDEALRFRRPDTAPLDYAMTQNNRATILSDLATLPGEDRGGRLYAALAAYDEALRFYQPDTAPLAYAMTQNNRATILSDLATLPGEDRRTRLYAALRCAVEAIALFERYEQVQYLAVGRRVLRDLRHACGDDFTALWHDLDLGDPPPWLHEDDQDQKLAALIDAFASIKDGEALLTFWRAVPGEMEEPFMQTVAARIAQAEAAGDQGAVDAWRSRLDGFRQLCDAAAANAIPPALQTALDAYLAQVKATADDDPAVAAWQAITALGEALLEEEAQGWQGLDWSALRQRIAGNYNRLGVALDTQGDKVAALAAYERAIALQPDFAMWQRNRAGMLIELGQLDAARTAINQARALEPDAPRLANLEAQWTAAHTVV